jgi:hypothetical protein
MTADARVHANCPSRLVPSRLPDKATFPPLITAIAALDVAALATLSCTQEVQEAQSRALRGPPGCDDVCANTWSADTPSGTRKSLRVSRCTWEVAPHAGDRPRYGRSIRKLHDRGRGRACREASSNYARKGVRHCREVSLFNCLVSFPSIYCTTRVSLFSSPRA